MARLVLDDAGCGRGGCARAYRSSHDARPTGRRRVCANGMQKSGFHVAYITDHKRFGGAIDAVATQSARAGDGVVLLSGLELRSGGQHVNVLSMTQAESTLHRAG